MGLTIHYRLSWPTNSVREGIDAVTKLRQKCMDLPFETVGKIKTFAGSECDYEKARSEGREDDVWLLIQSRGSVYCSSKGNRITAVCNPNENNWNMIMEVVPKAVVAFDTWPGDGCEAANFGLRLLPNSISVTPDGGTRQRLPVSPKDRGWTWGSFCKTQYANNSKYGGLEHFLRCHLTVIAALDAAKELGFKVDVSDEGNFWSKRSIAELSREIGEWDTFIAGMSAALGAAATEHGMTVESAIADRPDFERLKTEALKDPKLKDLVARTKAVFDGLQPAIESANKPAAA